MSLCPFGYSWNAVHLHFSVLFCFFFSLRSMFQCLSVGPVYCSQEPQTSFFNKIFIKNGSHDTIYIFKNYFATMFLIFSFQQNKRYPNKLLLKRKKSCNERFQDHFMRCLPKVAKQLYWRLYFAFGTVIFLII